MALPKKKTSELADRFNAVRFSEHGEFTLRQIAREAMENYQQTQQAESLLLVAVCHQYLGKFQDALDVYNSVFSSIDFDNPRSTLYPSFYVQYALLLKILQDYQGSINVLDNLYQRNLHHTDMQIGWSMTFLYGESQAYDKMFELRDELIKLWPDKADCFVTPIMIGYYLQEGDQEAAIKCFYDLAKKYNHENLRLDNLDEFLDVIADSLTHPKIQPNLLEREAVYLNEIRDIMISQLSHKSPEVKTRKVLPLDTFMQVGRKFSKENAHLMSELAK